jgi:hypothetical protein
MSDDGHTAGTFWGWVGALWGGLGVSALLGFAIYRLAPVAWTALGMDLTGLQWGILVVWVLGMGVGEGYRGFQRAFSPRVAARCRHLRDHPTPLRVLTAPIFAMAFYGAPRRRRVAAFALSAGIVVLVLLVRRLEQPWRGIVDAGVVLGLAWGLVSLMIAWGRAMTQDTFDASPEIG